MRDLERRVRISDTITNKMNLAEEEYKWSIRMHHSLEARYRLGLLFKKQQRKQEAGEQFQAAVDEIELHPRYVRRLHVQWARLSKRELSSL